jgi:hypothetical protein
MLNRVPITNMINIYVNQTHLRNLMLNMRQESGPAYFTTRVMYFVLPINYEITTSRDGWK